MGKKTPNNIIYSHKISLLVRYGRDNQTVVIRKIHRKTYVEVFFSIGCRLRPAKKGPLVEVFSCEFSGIFKNTFFNEHLWTTSSYSRTLFHGYLCIILDHHFITLLEIWIFIQCSLISISGQ